MYQHQVAGFQLTRSRGAWPWCFDFTKFYKYFNSHAHVERDGRNSGQFHERANFNSHAHVERDLLNLIGYYLKHISTHTLTWSVTTTLQIPLTAETISTHTLTWSVTSKNEKQQSIDKFQLTRSRGAWLEIYSVGMALGHFNSHAHVERDWWRCKNAWILCHFNSHAHVERD